MIGAEIQRLLKEFEVQVIVAFHPETGEVIFCGESPQKQIEGEFGWDGIMWAKDRYYLDEFVEELKRKGYKVAGLRITADEITGCKL